MSPRTFVPNAATASTQASAAVAAAQAQVTNWRAMTEKALADFAAAHGADLQAGSLSALFAGGVVPAARRVFDTADALIATTAKLAASTDYTDTYKADALAKATAAAGAGWAADLTDFDKGLGQLVASAAKAAYPKLPADADEGRLWAEAADVLNASASPPSVALMNLAAAERRDLAAVALSPRASTWAGTKGLTTKDLQRVRAAAIDAAKALGTPSEQAAARVYRPASELLGWRSAILNAVKGAADVAAPGRPLPFDYRDAMGDAPNLLSWRDGPNDAAPITTV